MVAFGSLLLVVENLGTRAYHRGTWMREKRHQLTTQTTGQIRDRFGDKEKSQRSRSPSSPPPPPPPPSTGDRNRNLFERRSGAGAVDFLASKCFVVRSLTLHQISDLGPTCRSFNWKLIATKMFLLVCRYFHQHSEINSIVIVTTSLSRHS